MQLQEMNLVTDKRESLQDYHFKKDSEYHSKKRRKPNRGTSQPHKYAIQIEASGMEYYERSSRAGLSADPQSRRIAYSCIWDYIYKSTNNISDYNQYYVHASDILILN